MNPAMLRPYQRANEIRSERENFAAWLNGLYTWKALVSALSGFGGKKGKRIDYPNEPLPFSKDAEEEAERKKMERMKAQFGAFAEGLEKKWRSQRKM